MHIYCVALVDTDDGSNSFLQEMLAEYLCFLELAINSFLSCQDYNYWKMMGVWLVKEKAKKTLLEVSHVLTTKKLQEDILDVWSVAIARILWQSFYRQIHGISCSIHVLYLCSFKFVKYCRSTSWGHLSALSRWRVCMSISTRHSSYDLNSKHDYHHSLSLLSSTKKISTI